MKKCFVVGTYRIFLVFSDKYAYIFKIIKKNKDK